MLNAKGKTRNVIFITFDGLRWQEVFYGADSLLINNDEYTKERNQILEDYWADTPQTRREKLMPFFWSTINTEGQIYGNVRKGGAVTLANPHGFSYPGFSEMLVGYVDSTRDSNDRENNPNVTILEYVHNQPGFRGKVAAFCSWDVFDFIINEERSGILVNSGMEPFEGKYNGPKIGLLNEIMFQIPVPWKSVRYDAITHHFAMDYLKQHKPKLLYIAYDETDEYAHEGKYDQYLIATNLLDEYIAELWNWTQKNYHYKNKTTILITTDHGRGHETIDAWRNHGSLVTGAEHVWMAVLGPDTPPMGEVLDNEPMTSSQVAATIGAFLGFEYINEKPVGPVMNSMFYDVPR